MRQFKSSAEGNAMNCRDRGKVAHASILFHTRWMRSRNSPRLRPLVLLHLLRSKVQLPQIRACAETRLQRLVRSGQWASRPARRAHRKTFPVPRVEQPNLIAGRTMKRKLNDAFVQNPRHRSSLENRSCSFYPLTRPVPRAASQRPTTNSERPTTVPTPQPSPDTCPRSARAESAQ